MSRKSPRIALFLAVLLFAAACGSDNIADVEPGIGVVVSAAQDVPGDEEPGDDEVPEGPIPVEPDGGIGDGAEPLPGAEEPADEGTWHGAVVAETNCPGTTFKQVEARRFTFWVPEDFIEVDVQGVDSEVAEWANGNGIEMFYDYGWYSGSLSQTPGAEVTPVDYSGIVGEVAVVRAPTAGESNMVGIYFGEVERDLDQWNKLGLVVTHTDPDDEIIGRCIVGSIDWK